MLGNRSVPFKLPNVRRPVSSVSKTNGNFRLKPVVPKNITPPKEVMAKKPVITKKLAPVAISSPSNPKLAIRTSKSVTGFVSKPSDMKEPTVSARGNSSVSRKTHVSFVIQIFIFVTFFHTFSLIIFSAFSSYDATRKYGRVWKLWALFQ